MHVIGRSSNVCHQLCTVQNYPTHNSLDSSKFDLWKHSTRRSSTALPAAVPDAFRTSSCVSEMGFPFPRRKNHQSRCRAVFCERHWLSLAAARRGKWNQPAFVRSCDCGPNVDSMPSPPPHQQRSRNQGFPSQNLRCLEEYVRFSGRFSTYPTMRRIGEAPRSKSRMLSL